MQETWHKEHWAGYRLEEQQHIYVMEQDGTKYVKLKAERLLTITFSKKLPLI